jgi:2-polyprenyl-3-methyl-5-hydroxy-6-metoxy-1,4-benzoquinol methylase
MEKISEYNQNVSFVYDLKESRLKKVVKLIDELPTGEMLDIGCSRGLWGSLWRSKGWRVGGLDIDQGSIQAARSVGIDAKFCDLNKDQIPFEDGKFDLIFAGEVIEHLIDTDGFLRELKRCLKKGGKLILTTPNLVSFENRIRVILGSIPSGSTIA